MYDPACGSGSMLLKFAKVLGKENVRQGFFGQEINITTYNLCQINMFLHDINYEKFNIAHGDTLTDPKHWDDEPFDCIVSNIAISSYVEQENTTEEVDIEKLNAQIAEIVIRQNKLRIAIDEIVADLEGSTL